MQEDLTIRKPPEGHVYIVSGTPTKADRSMISLPIITRELHIKPTGIKAASAFTAGVVMHESRTLLRTYAQIIGDIEFEVDKFQFKIDREEQWMRATSEDMLSELEVVATTPASIIEEQVTLETIRAVRRRKEFLTGSQS